MRYLPVTREYVDAKMDSMKDQMDELGKHQNKCMEYHEHNKKFQARTDSDMADIGVTLKDTLDTNREILGTIKEYLPTLERTQAAYITQDTMKDAAIWIAAISAGGAGLHYLLQLILS